MNSFHSRVIYGAKNRDRTCDHSVVYLNRSIAPLFHEFDNGKPLEISITNELFPMPPEDKFMNGIIAKSS